MLKNCHSEEGNKWPLKSCGCHQIFLAMRPLESVQKPHRSVCKIRPQGGGEDCNG